ncbi:MAG: radical SAM family heme chaperone HemW [Pseudomonadota bacterium]
MYVHIPFCRSRCRYCGFVSNPYDPGTVSDYVRALKKEIELLRTRTDLFPTWPCVVDSVYFGGGTPSLPAPAHVERILEAVYEGFEVLDDAEISIEVNPSTADVTAMRRLGAIGFNRAGLGLQSLHDEELRRMGRTHTAVEGLRAFHNLRESGFSNISTDLIGGYPGQTLDSFGRSLEEIIKLRPEHISFYLLEVKDGTPLSVDIRRGAESLPDDDLAADMYEFLCERAVNAGYVHYEIANFAQPGCECRHNLKYWSDVPFFGLGSGAHGFTGRYRYANHDKLEDYFQALEYGRLPLASLNESSPEQRLRDALIMGLRRVGGLDLGALGREYDADVRSFVVQTIGHLADAELYTMQGDHIRLTPRGLLLSNVIFGCWV